jgi:hypothetical protein
MDQTITLLNSYQYPFKPIHINKKQHCYAKARTYPIRMCHINIRLCYIPISNHPEPCYCNIISHFIYVSQIVKVFYYVTQSALMQNSCVEVYSGGFD